MTRPTGRVEAAAPQPLDGGGLRSREELEAFVDGFVGGELEAYDVAGLTVAVVKDGQIFFAKGYGWADVDRQVPVEADKTLFRPGSVSKLFTWTAVMQLVEQGKLDLDADVNTYLTQFKIPATYPAPITLRHALTHTVGLEDGGIGYLMARSPQQIVPLARSLAAHMPARVRPVGTSGDGLSSSYSNWATSLAGLIVANVSGVSFEDYVEANILRPLGMDSSTFKEPLPEALEKRMSVGYSFEAGAFKPHGYEFIANFGPAGSLAATATDMARFMIAHLQEGATGDARILKPETARAMHARIFSPHPAVGGSGLGFYETYVNGRRIIGHGGDTNYFHSELGLLEKEGIGFFVSVNTGGKAALVPRHFVRAFMNHYFPARLPAVKPPDDFGARAAKVRRTLRRAPPFLHPVREGLRPAGRDRRRPDRQEHARHPRSVRAQRPVRGGGARGLPRGRRGQDGRVRRERRRPGRGDGRPVRLHPLLQAALVREPALPLRAARALPPVLPDRPRLGVAALEERQGGAAQPPAGPGATSACSEPSIWPSSWPSRRSSPRAWTTSSSPRPRACTRVLTLPLIGLALTALAVVLAVRVWREKYWTRGARLLHTAGVVAAIAFVWFLNYWNLLGYRIG